MGKDLGPRELAFVDSITEIGAGVLKQAKANIRLPDGFESCAITFTSPKTAALCYDRVWAGLRYDIPQGVAFYGHSYVAK